MSAATSQVEDSAQTSVVETEGKPDDDDDNDLDVPSTLLCSCSSFIGYFSLDTLVTGDVFPPRYDPPCYLGKRRAHDRRVN